MGVRARLGSQGHALPQRSSQHARRCRGRPCGGWRPRGRWTDSALGSASSKTSSSGGGPLQPAHGPDQPDDPGVAGRFGLPAVATSLAPRAWPPEGRGAGPLRLRRDRTRPDHGQTMAVNAASRAAMERAGLIYVSGLSHLDDRTHRGPRRDGEVEYEMTRGSGGARTTEVLFSACDRCPLPSSG